MKCLDCNGTGETFGSFACSHCMGSGELKEISLSMSDLERLRKNGVGGFTTIYEQNALLDMAAELLQRRQADKWIPVTDTEPADYEEVLFADFDPAECKEIVYGVGYRYGLEFIGQMLYPTHYRPLPEPPQVAP